MSAASERVRAIPPLLKHLNARAVLDTMREHAPVSRAEISRLAGISKPTVSLAIESLVEAGLVREADPRPDRPRYGAIFFEPVPDAALVLGFDLGARFLRGALCDLGGAIRARQDVELKDAGADHALAALASLRDGLVRTSHLDGGLIDGVVVGVPGVVEVGSGRLRLAANVPGLEDRDFAADVGERLGLPVVLENDINLAAVGERWRGVARGIDDFVFLSVGTGLGAGLVLRGELHRGHHGAAGEVDYALGGIGREVDPCAAAISALATQVMSGEDAGAAIPTDVPALFAAARSGNALARRVVEEEAERIALHVAPIAAVTDVALVVLGGGIGANGDLLLGPVRARLRERLPYPPRVEVSSLGDAAVLTGALAVGLRSALDNVFVSRNGPAAR